MRVNVTTSAFEAGKTPFHRLWNQFAVTLNTAGLVPGKTYPAGSYMCCMTGPETDVLEAEVQNNMKIMVDTSVSIKYIQGILTQDFTMGVNTGTTATVSVAFGGILYRDLMDLVNGTTSDGGVGNGYSIGNWLHDGRLVIQKDLQNDPNDPAGDKVYLPEHPWARNFKMFNRRKAAKLDNKM